MNWQGVIEKYWEFLPITKKTPIVSLDEGNTPLLPARNIKIGKLNIYFKCEGFNPTGSFKDRGMTVAVSKALEEGSKAVMCASTGNTSASAAAYAARAGIKCFVLIPKGAIALGKLAQALMHGADVIAVDANFDEALKIVREITSKYPVTLVNSINPYRLQGQKTAAFEICDELGDAPAYHALPVGNAGNITAYWMGYREYYDAGIIKRLPKMLGFQAENLQTIATAIRIRNPASWEGAVNASKESGGLIDKVTDDEILDAYKKLASIEGIFVEPASAASLAGVLKLNLKEEAVVVCTLTGHGLKDPELAVKTVGQPRVCKADIKEIVRELGL